MLARLSFRLAATVAVLGAAGSSHAAAPALDALPAPDPVPVARCAPLTIPFDLDATRLPTDAQPALEALAQCLIASGQAVAIEGHTEARGTPEYALALAERRAKAVAKALVGLGVAAARIKTVSYGLERPVCTQTTETCRAKNRRAEVVPE